MDCLFCKIVSGKIPSKKIYEDEDVYAFYDIHPQAPTHCLFIPKKHFESLADIPAGEMETVTKLFTALRKVADQQGISSRGFRTIINTRAEGGQTVNHLHIHLLAGRQMGPNMSGG